MKLVVFDFDGTLVNLKVNWKELKEALQILYKKTYKIHKNFTPLNIILNEIIQDTNNIFKRDISNVISSFENKYISEYTIIKKNLSLADYYITNNIKLAIFSSNTRNTIISILNQLNRVDQFEIIISFDDVNQLKPNPEGLYKISNLLSIKLHDMLFIGNSVFDLEAGKRANVVTQFYEHEYASK